MHTYTLDISYNIYNKHASKAVGADVLGLSFVGFFVFLVSIAPVRDRISLIKSLTGSKSELILVFSVVQSSFAVSNYELVAVVCCSLK